MFTTIHRYIFKELVKAFLISVATLTALLYLERLLYMTTLIFNRGATFVEVALMMVYISPAFLAITVPMSILVAAVVVFNRFSADSEIYAMKASGWSFMYLMRSVIGFSISASVLTTFIIFIALPWGNTSLRSAIYDMVKNRANFNIKPHVFNSEFTDLTLFVKGKESDVELNDIFVAQRLENGNTQTAVARKAFIAADRDSFRIQLRLKNGTLHSNSEENQNYRMVKFDRYDINLNLPSAEKIHQGMVGNRERSYEWIKNHIVTLKKEGKPTYRWEMINSKKFALAASCLLFGIIGAPLGIKSSRAGKSGGYVIALFLITIYFVSLILLQNFGSEGIINPVISVWIPNIVFLFLAIYFSRKAQKEIPYKIFGKIFDVIIGVLEGIKNIFRKITNSEKVITSTQPVRGASIKETEIARQLAREKFRKLKAQKTRK
ncbi:MAG: LptF/LptG family permease [Nitrospinales bacterium]